MTQGQPKWTAQQRLAIETRGRDVLVTASAGTGKTAVLAERCVQVLTGPNAVDVGRILVMTFTDAAAEEMRGRIAARLRQRYAATRDARLRHQLLMIDAAEISTIHSFCKRLITEHFYRLGIDPAFRILEPDEQMLLKADILSQVVEEAWADAAVAPGLAMLLERRNVGGGRMDFLNTVVEVSDFLDSVAGREAFYERARRLADAACSVSGDLAEKQRAIIVGKLEECWSRLRYALVLDGRLAGGHWSGQIEEQMLGPVERCIALMEAGDAAGCAEAVWDFKPAQFIRRPKGMDDQVAETVKGPAKKAMEIFKGLRDLAVINPDYAEIVGGAAGLQTKVLIELVQRFDRRFEEAKRRANCLDFADLEHLALRLLEENADIAGKLRQRFAHIFVDEYQDINALQQAIIDRIAAGDNVFAVGDIKQSIYGFRQSRPDIFLERLARATVEDADGEDQQVKGRLPAGLRVDLGHNFRSRAGILDFANALFGRIMKASVAAIDYDSRAALTAGLEYRPLDGETKDGLVELVVLDEDAAEHDAGDDDADGEERGAGNAAAQTISAVQRQAAFVAWRIRQMVGADGGKAEFEVYDRATGTYRPVQYGDIVILMRSLSHTAKAYVEILRLAGVPVNSQSCAGYFATTEIADCICLLKVLDNPRQDIEFAAVLRSPFFGVTETELAEICVHAGNHGRGGRRTCFCERVQKYVDTGRDAALRDKLGAVLARLATWRVVASRQGLAQLIRTVYAETDYAAFVSALPNGRQRKANLYKLHDRAIQFGGFAAMRTTSLSRFVEYVEKLLEKEEDWAPAAPETSAENAVRLMSIHKSKGLEFPVVFLAETNRRFNQRDVTSDCLVDDPEAIGLRIVEPYSRAKLGSIGHQVIAEKKRAMMLAEEMRLLYVAVTRARERLVITSSRTARQCAGILNECAVMDGAGPADWQVRSAQCHFDWLLYAFGGQRRVREAFGLDGGAETAEGALFSVERVDRGRLDRLSTMIMTKRQSMFAAGGDCGSAAISKEGAAAVERIAASVNWRYPWADVTAIAAKQSVSELSHREDEFGAMDLAAAFDRVPAAVYEPRGRVGGDARARGTAVHLVLQHIDLGGPVTAEAVKQTVQRLVAAGAMAEHAAAAVDAGAIVRFFESDLGRLVRENAAGVLREWPFTIGLDARELGATSAGELVIVQGIIDVVVRTGDGLVVIDFKTDNVDAAGAEQRAELYRKQMQYYAKAAGRILRRPVRAGWLYFLTCGCAVGVDVAQSADGPAGM